MKKPICQAFVQNTGLYTLYKQRQLEFNETILNNWPSFKSLMLYKAIDEV